jgi:hypothetical protein
MGLADRAARGLEAPGDLRVRHELGQFVVHVTRERLVKLGRSSNRKPSCGGRIGGPVSGGRSAMRVFTDSPASGAKPAM